MSIRPRRTALLLPILLVLAPAVQAGRAPDMRKRAFQDLNDGVAAYNRGEYALAVEKLQAVTAVALNSFRGYLYLGQALTAARRFPEAVEALDVALDLEPDDLGAHVARANALLGQGDLGTSLPLPRRPTLQSIEAFLEVAHRHTRLTSDNL